MDNTVSGEIRAARLRRLWKRITPPIKIGLLCALLAALMALAGWILRPDYTSRSLVSLFLALVISAGTWGLVSWAIAQAAYEVGTDKE
jgi:hypothetical protein